MNDPIPGSRAATAALASAAAFVLLLVALHALRTDLQPSWHMVSEYSIGPWGVLMRLGFLALATSLFGLALALRGHASGVLGAAGRAFLAVAGLGAAMGGLFNTDPPNTAPEQMSTTGMLHGFAFMLGVPGILLAATLLNIALLRRPAWRQHRLPLLATAAIVWLTMGVFGHAMASALASGATGELFLVGWQNRAAVVAWALWVGTLAALIRRLDSATQS